MSIEIKIPSVGESITSGLISTWHKKDGEQVSKGDVLFTLETDKVSTEITAEESGILHIKAEEGAEVLIGEVVATIEEGAAPAQSATPAETPKPEKKAEAPAPEKAANREPEPSKTVEKPAEKPAPSSSLATVAPVAKTPAAPSPTAIAIPSDARVTRKKMSPLRRKIATQLVMAQQTAAILTTFNECDMGAIMSLRKKMQEDFQKLHGVKLGFMSFFIKGVVKALKDVPSINGFMDGNDFVQNHFFDIGVAVGTEKGLVVPVVRDADQKTFADIERDLVEYAKKARDGKITIEDLQGGVFTISNGGTYGSLLSTPILNPPQSGILGMHKIQERPMAINGQVVIRPMMYLALSYDHRVVDGKGAVTFLVRLKELLEEPSRLLLDL